MPPEFKGVQNIKRLTALKPYKDTVSCAMQIKHGREPTVYRDPYESAFLDENVCKNQNRKIVCLHH